MIADVNINKKRNPIVTELFIRGRKLNISLIILTISFCCAKKILCTIMKIPNKWKL